MATRQHIATRPLLVILLMCCPAASGAGESSSLRMAVLLQELAHQFQQRVPSDLDTYNLSRASAANLRKQVAATSPGPQRRQLRLQMAIQLLRAGETRAAIAELENLQGKSDLSPALHTMIHDRLGIAYLRLGEQENCLLNHTIDSCLLPIRGEGVHTSHEGSIAA